MAESRNGQFIYRDTFFVEVGEGKRHPRASTAELKELLLPGKHSTPPKDQVGHWYEAQLIHYGLTRSKDKNTAKVRLTNALSSGALVVPASIQQIESDLKKEYASVQRKAKLAASKEKAVKPEAASTTKKRKADALEGGSTKVSVKVGDVVIEIDQQSLLAAGAEKKRKSVAADSPPPPKSTPKKKAAKEPKLTKATAPQEKKSPTAKSQQGLKAKVKHKVNGVSCYGPDATGVNQWKCEPCRQQSQNSFLSSPAKRSSQSSTRNLDTSNSSRPKQTARRGKPFNYAGQSSRAQPQSLREPTPMSICSSEASQEDPPPPYSEAGYNRNDTRSTESPGQVIQVSGSYSIRLSGNLGWTNLMLRTSQPRDQMWGRFTMGDKTGFLRLDSIAGIASSERKSFGWRTEDQETGRLRFGKGCDGWIEFDGHGSVQGTFYSVNDGKDVDFDGRLEEAFDYESAEERETEIEELSTTWHGFPHRAYGSGR